MPAPKDPEKYKLWIQRISESKKGSKWSDERHKKCDGRKHTLEEIQKMKEARKRHDEENGGRKHTDASKKKMRDSHIGKKASPDTILRLKESHTGLKMPARTENYRKKMSEIKKGSIPRNLPQSKKGTPEYIKWLINVAESQRGKELSEMTILKMIEKRVGGFWYGNIRYDEDNLLLKIRLHEKMDEWRFAVFKRDNFKDWYSGCEGYLQAHHIVPFKELLKINNIKSVEQAIECDALWDINNGMTLLESSHRFIHNCWGY